MRLVGWRARAAAIALAAILSACATPEPPEAPGAEDQPVELLLEGVLTRADHQTYRELPFDVPAGIASIEVALDHDGGGDRTVIDLGLSDPHGVRGWSGGARRVISVMEHSATPSYRPGPMTPGRWAVILGVPNVRNGVRTPYAVRIIMRRSGHGMPALNPEPGWRAGDFHTHSGHSDASCPDSRGVRVPCPISRTVEAAVAAGLGFVVVSDHNTLSQAMSLREEQQVHRDILLVAGVEITTFFGHANAFGLTRIPPFRVRSPADLAIVANDVAAQGGVMSVNHPAQPSGEACMGCGWTLPTLPEDAAVEVINGASLRLAGPEGSGSGLAYWRARLDEGRRATGIGGSDNHDPTDRSGLRQSPVGRPATFVWMEDLSEASLREGVVSGCVFIDLVGAGERRLSVSATDPSGRRVGMGGEIRLGPGQPATASVRISGFGDVAIAPVSGGLEVTPADAGDEGGVRGASFDLTLADGRDHGWFRADIRDADGRLVAIGNPVYIRSAGRTGTPASGCPEASEVRRSGGSASSF